MQHVLMSLAAQLLGSFGFVTVILLALVAMAVLKAGILRLLKWADFRHCLVASLVSNGVAALALALGFLAAGSLLAWIAAPVLSALQISPEYLNASPYPTSGPVTAIQAIVSLSLTFAAVEAIVLMAFRRDRPMLAYAGAVAGNVVSGLILIVAWLAFAPPGA